MILKLKSSWHRRRRSKILAVSLKHWKGRTGGGPLRRTAVLIHPCVSPWSYLLCGWPNSALRPAGGGGGQGLIHPDIPPPVGYLQHCGETWCWLRVCHHGFAPSDGSHNPPLFFCHLGCFALGLRPFVPPWRAPPHPPATKSGAPWAGGNSGYIHGRTLHTLPTYKDRLRAGNGAKRQCRIYGRVCSDCQQEKVRHILRGLWVALWVAFWVVFPGGSNLLERGLGSRPAQPAMQNKRVGGRREEGGGGWHKASVLGCLPLVAPCPPPPSRLTRCIRMHLVNGMGNSPSPGQPTPGVVKQDKSSRGSADTTKKNQFGPTEGQNEQWREASTHQHTETRFGPPLPARLRPNYVPRL